VLLRSLREHACRTQAVDEPWLLELRLADAQDPLARASNSASGHRAELEGNSASSSPLSFGARNARFTVASSSVRARSITVQLARASGEVVGKAPERGVRDHMPGALRTHP
jgi:hypothetical protein